MKKIIRLTEAQLDNIVKSFNEENDESMFEVENSGPDYGNFMMYAQKLKENGVTNKQLIEKLLKLPKPELSTSNEKPEDNSYEVQPGANYMNMAPLGEQKKMSLCELTTDTVLLRKLAPKSIIGFGKDKGLSVQQVLDLKHTAHLRWMYYNIAGISFTDDVLEQIGVLGPNDDHRIQKPGTDPELGQKLFDDKKRRMDLGMRSHAKRLQRGSDIHRKISNDKFDSKIFNKGRMQSRNHGRT